MLTRDERGALETDLRALAEAGDLTRLLTVALEGYGPELYRFVAALARTPDHAADLFGGLCENLWKYLPGFRWESSFRVWAYAIARTELLRSLRERDKAQRNVPLSAAPQILEVADRVRTATALHLRTDVKDAVAGLRASLDPEDHILLGLRVDREMSWNDIARVLGSTKKTLERDAAALRKRFERIKKQLRELAEAHDIVPR